MRVSNWRGERYDEREGEEKKNEHKSAANNLLSLSTLTEVNAHA